VKKPAGKLFSGLGLMNSKTMAQANKATPKNRAVLNAGNFIRSFFLVFYFLDENQGSLVKLCLTLN